jgi:hypothetical protein
MTQGRAPKKNERPVGVPAARGHGVMEVQTHSKRSASGGAPESLHSLDRIAALCLERSEYAI